MELNTFSIAAYDASTGELGVAVQSKASSRCLKLNSSRGVPSRSAGFVPTSSPPPPIFISSPATC